MKPDPKNEAWLKYTDVLQFYESASFEMVFKAGWQARDKLGDEALTKALSALEKFLPLLDACDGPVWHEAKAEVTAAVAESRGVMG